MTISDYSIKSAEQIERICNSYSLAPKQICEYMFRHMHKTNQQSFTRLCVAWLRMCGSEEYGRLADGRNEGSYKIGKKFVERFTDDELMLPMV